MPALAARGKPTPTPRAKGDAKYIVIAERQDGRRRVFNVYPTRAEADAIAERLCAVGCRAAVEVE